jgi:hypothetical protein
MQKNVYPFSKEVIGLLPKLLYQSHLHNAAQREHTAVEWYLYQSKEVKTAW